MRKPISVLLLLACAGASASATPLPSLVKDLNTDARGAYGSAPFNFVSAGGRAYFSLQSYLDTGYSIWTSATGASRGSSASGARTPPAPGRIP